MACNCISPVAVLYVNTSPSDAVVCRPGNINVVLFVLPIVILLVPFPVALNPIIIELSSLTAAVCD